MRMYEWTADMVRFMRDASEHTDFYEKLADALVDALGGAERVKPMRLCDAGCGLGYLSLALAKRCAHVTAVDVSAPALDVLRQNVARQGVCNVDARLTDVRLLPKNERFDAMIFCLFGRLSEIVPLADGRCQTAVIVKKNWSTRRFALDADVPERDTLGEAVTGLEAMGIPCQKRVAALELPQPFRSLEDAMLFFRIYGGRERLDDADMRKVHRRLQPGNDPEFPWVLPVPRELGILTFTPRTSV